MGGVDAKSCLDQDRSQDSFANPEEDLLPTGQGRKAFLLGAFVPVHRMLLHMWRYGKSFSRRSRKTLLGTERRICLRPPRGRVVCDGR